MYENIKSEELIEYCVRISKRINLMLKYPKNFPKIDIQIAKNEYYNVVSELVKRNYISDL